MTSGAASFTDRSASLPFDASTTVTPASLKLSASDHRISRPSSATRTRLGEDFSVVSGGKATPRFGVKPSTMLFCPYFEEPTSMYGHHFKNRSQQQEYAERRGPTPPEGEAAELPWCHR